MNVQVEEMAEKISEDRVMLKVHFKAGVCKNILMNLHSEGGVSKNIFLQTLETPAVGCISIEIF